MKMKIIDRTALAEPWHEYSVDDQNNLFRFEVLNVTPKKLKKVLKEMHNKLLRLTEKEDEEVIKFFYKNQHIMTYVPDEEKIFTHIKIGG